MERVEWLRDVELFTERDRFTFASAHVDKSFKALLACKCDPVGEDGKVVAFVDRETGEVTTRAWFGQVVCQHDSTARWHDYRAMGQRSRFQQIDNCGEERLALLCGDCGHKHGEQPKFCGHHRACVSCRGRRAYRMQQRFRKARKRALRRFSKARQGHEPGTARGRRWDEMFLTLTYPDSGEPAQDVVEIYKAWPAFIRRVRLYLENRGVRKEIALAMPFLRVLEITPGEVGGHAHLHVWMLGPFIHHSILRAMWGRSLDAEAYKRLPQKKLVDLLEMDLPFAHDHVVAALKLERDGKLDLNRRDALQAARLRKDGRPQPTVPWPVIDIRKVTGDPSRELIKYLVKDIVNSELIDSFTFSRIFVALEGRRVAITSRKLWLVVHPSECPKCEAIGAVVTEKVTSDHADPTDPCRGPPAVAA